MRPFGSGLVQGVEEREVIVVALGFFAAAFVWANFATIRRLPDYRLLVLAVVALILGWTVSVTEDVFPFSFANVIEHALYATHSVFLASWAFRVSTRHTPR